jgi:hypothetical protein
MPKRAELRLKRKKRRNILPRKLCQNTVLKTESNFLEVDPKIYSWKSIILITV